MASFLLVMSLISLYFTWSIQNNINNIVTGIVTKKMNEDVQTVQLVTLT